VNPSSPESDLRTLSRLLKMEIPIAELPYELIWNGIYELEVVRQEERILLVGVLATRLAPDDSLLPQVAAKRTREFSRPDVFLAYQNDLGRLILWTELSPGGNEDLYAVQLRQLLEEMDHLRPVLPSL
jgi:hypothetical protein